MIGCRHTGPLGVARALASLRQEAKDGVGALEGLASRDLLPTVREEESALGCRGDYVQMLWKKRSSR